MKAGIVSRPSCFILPGWERYFVCGFVPVDDEPDPPDDDEPLGIDEPDEDDPLVEDEPLGEAAGLLDDDASVAAWTPSFAAVSLSSRPVVFRPSFCW